MNIISFINFIAFSFTAYAIFLVIIFWKRKFNTSEFTSLLLLLGSTSIIYFNEFYEWTLYTDDPAYEQKFTDYLAILLPAFWGAFYYVFILAKYQRSIEDSYSHARSVIENMPMMLQAVDKKGSIVAWNSRAQRLTGYTLEELKKFKSMNFFSDKINQKANLYNLIDAQKLEDKNIRNTISIKCKNGKKKTVAWYKTSNDHAIPGWKEWGVGFDISHELDIQSRLKHIASHDALTDLPNLTLLKQRLNNLQANKYNSLAFGALLLIDIDNFKTINNTMGYSYGDELLIILARLLSEAIGNHVFRFGGDEFYILLEKLDSQNAIKKVINKLYKTVAKPISLSNNSSISLTLSIGISLHIDNTLSAEEMIQHADLAMYAAKNKSRNSYSFYSLSMQEALQRQHQLCEMLRRAIEKDQLELYYQPQIGGNNYELIGAEALMRWRLSDGSFISPAEFIPVAENFGLINKLGMWVMDKACQQFSSWKYLDSIESIAINVSAEQFYKKDFVSSYIAITEKYSIATEKIDLEITESVLLDNIQTAIEVMHKLRDAGFKLSIDDFGTGYSSLAYLKDFPINKIKIDQTFIRNIDKDPINQAIVISIIELGHNLNKKVLAEGIETQQELDTLKEHGCTCIQGYYFSKPQPFDALNLWVENYQKNNTLHKNQNNNKKIQNKHS